MLRGQWLAIWLGSVESGAAGFKGMLLCASKIIGTTTPNGTSDRSCHQPLRLVSCSRLAPTAISGRSVTSENNAQTLKEISDATALPSTTARKNHQYSVRVARPLNSAYFARHAFTASTIGIKYLQFSTLGSLLPCRGDRQTSSGGPAAPAKSCGFIRSTLNLVARSRIVFSTSSSGGGSPLIQRSGLIRATTNERK